MNMNSLKIQIFQHGIKGFIINSKSRGQNCLVSRIRIISIIQLNANNRKHFAP